VVLIQSLGDVVSVNKLDTPRFQIALEEGGLSRAIAADQHPQLLHIAY
jgi:hypothetical protein